jgi:hypothetical protein
LDGTKWKEEEDEGDYKTTFAECDKENLILKTWVLGSEQQNIALNIVKF